MKKISHFTLDDILMRRTLNSFTKPIDKTSTNPKPKPNQQDEFFEFNENELLMNVFEDFKATEKNTAPVFSNQIKTKLVKVIAKKINIKLNETKMAQKIKIKKYQHIHILDKSQHHFNKKQLHSITVDIKKLDLTLNNDSRPLTAHKKYSYFVLSGHLYIYEKDLKQDAKQKRSYDEETSDETAFYNWKQFELEYPSYKRAKTLSQFTALGPVFTHKTVTQQQNNLNDKDSQLQRQNSGYNKSFELTIADDAIVVQIQNPEYQDEYINIAGMEFDKMAERIENFFIFNSLGKKIRNYVQFFQFKEYQKNQHVYSIGDPVNKFYLILKGDIVFESKNNTDPINSPSASPKQNRKKSIHTRMNVKTQIFSSGNYFGQEQIIFNLSQRLMVAKCKSSICQLLQISRQKFEKMLQYSDFYEFMKKGAQVKFRQRLLKLQKNRQIRNQLLLTDFNQINSDEHNRKVPLQINTVPIFGGTNRNHDGRFKVMHGQLIRQFSKQQEQKMGEEVNFSMLKVNPDMYDKTMDKFRKYNIKPREKYVPQVNWELKRVWKVLNLENVLREQAQVTSPEGRKFYDSHKRYVCQIRQSKSLRPKTSSSTYRTKLQYIAYLQKFRSQS